jgi:transposase
MGFVRYKKFGKKEYAYEITSYWDTKLGKPRQKSKYLGMVVDKKKKIFKKKEIKQKVEKLILDFGDTFLLNEFVKQIKFSSIVKDVFDGDYANQLLSLVFYRLCQPSSMCHTNTWYEGNYARLLFKDLDLSSQRISELLTYFGREDLQRKFMKSYVKEFVSSNEGIIIDGTALPNQISHPFTEWGYHDGGIDKQIKFLFVVDKVHGLPIFFRYVPGNISDVSTFTTTIGELKKLGIKKSFVLVDAGFYSQENLTSMYDENIDFLIRLPAGKTLYKELIEKETHDLEKVCNAVRYGEKRALFIKQVKVNIFNKKGYASIILDPERKGKEVTKELISAIEEGKSDESVEESLKRKGILILLSSFEVKKEDILQQYYTRQTVEKLFGFSKDDLKILPLRVHKEDTLRGFLFITYVALILFVLLKQKLKQSYSVEEALMVMRNLKCKVYDEDILTQELTKNQKDITSLFNILVPNSLGI